MALEPALSCTAALLSPSTGIVDSHAYMLALQGEAEAAGALFAFHAPVTGGRVAGDGDRDRGRRRRADGAARAHAWSTPPGCTRRRWRARIAGMPRQLVPARLLREGQLFHPGRHARRSRRLIYPVPVPGGPGRAPDHRPRRPGAVRAGRGVDRRASTTASIRARADVFYAAIRRYWPALPDGALLPGYAGIRPKIVPPGDRRRRTSSSRDRATHGVAGPGQPVRHRKSRPDGGDRAGGGGARPRRRLNRAAHKNIRST